MAFGSRKKVDFEAAMAAPTGVIYSDDWSGSKQQKADQKIIETSADPKAVEQARADLVRNGETTTLEWAETCRADPNAGKKAKRFFIVGGIGLFAVWCVSHALWGLPSEIETPADDYALSYQSLNCGDVPDQARCWSESKARGLIIAVEKYHSKHGKFPTHSKYEPIVNYIKRNR